MRDISTVFAFVVFLSLLSLTFARCRYNLNQTYYPYHTDYEPFELGQLSACKDYIQPGRLGCCNRFNDEATLKNFKQIDGIFGKQGGGCDICAINLKRFWCQYACSERQHEFMDTAKDYETFPDPQKAGNFLQGMRVMVRVHTDTACALYNSCKRNSFVSSVSAMGSPAGFLNFQGHNAINDGHQYVSFNFSYNINDSLAFTNTLNDFAYADLSICSEKTSASEIHNFTMTENCTCSTCEQACDPNDGFVYTEADVLEDFNYQLVGGTYLFAIVMASIITVYRYRKSKVDRDD